MNRAKRQIGRAKKERQLQNKQVAFYSKAFF
jgi:hypothetical protein